jgi:hypothetical protein
VGAGTDPRTTLRPRLRVRVSPRRVRIGRRTRITFRVTAGGRPVARALVRFAGRGVRTDAGGRAVFRHRFHHVLLRRVTVTLRNYRGTSARVRILRRAGP